MDSDSGRFAFVVWRPWAERDAAEKKHIRSHGMRGKNKRVGSRRWKREHAKQEAQGQTEEEVRVSDADYDDISPVGSLDAQHSRQSLPLRQLYMSTSRSLVLLPTIVHVDEETRTLAANALRSPLELLHDLTMYLRISQSTYLVDSFVEFDFPKEALGLPPLDDGMIQVMLSINCLAQDFAQDRALTPPTHSHLAMTFGLLNRKVAAKDSHRDILTVYHIVFLAIVAIGLGDLEALRAHILALHKIVELNGGPEGTWWFPQLQCKLELLDLLSCLNSGGSPLFLKPRVRRGGRSLVDDVPALEFARSVEPPWCSGLDPELMAVYRDLKCLTSLINRHSKAKKKVEFRVYRPAFSSIASRLLSFDRAFDACADEYLCVGMMAFVLSFLQLPKKQPTHAHFGARVRSAIKRAQDSGSPLPPQNLARWLIIMTALSVLDPQDALLREHWDENIGFGSSWKTVGTQLKEMLWIDSVHDELVKKAFEVLNRRVVRVSG